MIIKTSFDTVVRHLNLRLLRFLLRRRGRPPLQHLREGLHRQSRVRCRGRRIRTAALCPGRSPRSALVLGLLLCLSPSRRLERSSRLPDQSHLPLDRPYPPQYRGWRRHTVLIVIGRGAGPRVPRRRGNEILVRHHGKRRSEQSEALVQLGPFVPYLRHPEQDGCDADGVDLPAGGGGRGPLLDLEGFGVALPRSPVVADASTESPQLVQRGGDLGFVHGVPGRPPNVEGAFEAAQGVRRPSQFRLVLPHVVEEGGALEEMTPGALGILVDDPLDLGGGGALGDADGEGRGCGRDDDRREVEGVAKVPGRLLPLALLEEYPAAIVQGDGEDESYRGDARGRRGWGVGGVLVERGAARRGAGLPHDVVEPPLAYRPHLLVRAAGVVEPSHPVVALPQGVERHHRIRVGPRRLRRRRRRRRRRGAENASTFSFRMDALRYEHRERYYKLAQDHGQDRGDVRTANCNK
mmetsp:Transcript_35927/g.107352  ORF Transcript_35927/g.107352 Transcript_35927/m.107352 type:complete len:465 (-) Transcript_35927:938-2332(-)